MHLNIGQGNSLGLGNLGGFINSAYWSSSEISQNQAWYRIFGSIPFIPSYQKDQTMIVRAIRAF